MKYNTPSKPEKIYHIFNHSVGQEFLFKEKANYIYFLNLIAKYIYPIAEIYVYNLLPNHFHILCKIKNEKKLEIRFKELYNNKEIDKDNWSKFISQQFSNCCNAYAKAYNKRYNRKGALFIDYLKHTEVDNIKYLIRLIKYIHYNAVHHEICTDIEDWYCSSYKTILSPKSTKLNRQFIIEVFNGRKDFSKAHLESPPYYSDELEFG